MSNNIKPKPLPNSCHHGHIAKYIKSGDKVEYHLVLTIRQMVNDKQNTVCYDSLCGIYPTLEHAIKTAVKLRK